MNSFKQFCENILQEKLITLGGKSYPKNGNVCLVIGGAGSGKDFAISNLLGIEGKIYDVDRLKELALQSKLLQAKYPELKNITLNNSDDTTKIHDIVNNKEHLDDKVLNALKKSIGSAKELPNLIFNVTLKSFSKLKEISDLVLSLNYKKENVHIVWVLTDLETALEQNKNRKRNVKDDILISAHKGVSETMNKIINDSEDARKYMDGDIWILFNKKSVDVEFEKPKKAQNGLSGFSNFIKGQKNQGNFITKSDYIKIKFQGKSLNKSEIKQEILQKIKSYVPDQKFS